MLRFALPIASLMLSGSLVGALSYSLQDGSGPLPTKTSFTAVIIDKNGVPNVECWELDSLTTMQKVQLKDGSFGIMSQTNLSTTMDQVTGVDVLTFPAGSALYPPPSGAHATDGDISFVLSCIQNGIVRTILKKFVCGMDSSSDEDEEEAIYFNQENGDDWFYFEDNSWESSVASKTDFKMDTVGNNGAEVVRFIYDKQPKHKVLHKGQCRFSGIEQPEDKKDFVSAGKVGAKVIIEL